MISYICIVVAMFIPIITAGYAKLSTKGYDNGSPRDFLSSLEGKGKRANYAQMNFYETFPAFAVGIVVAHQLNAPVSSIDMSAIVYVIARVFYAVFYVMDIHALRSLAWAVAFVSIIRLYFIGM